MSFLSISGTDGKWQKSHDFTLARIRSSSSLNQELRTCVIGWLVCEERAWLVATFSLFLPLYFSCFVFSHCTNGRVLPAGVWLPFVLVAVALRASLQVAAVWTGLVLAALRLPPRATLGVCPCLREGHSGGRRLIVVGGVIVPIPPIRE